MGVFPSLALLQGPSLQSVCSIDLFKLKQWARKWVMYASLAIAASYIADVCWAFDAMPRGWREIVILVAIPFGYAIFLSLPQVKTVFEME